MVIIHKEETGLDNLFAVIGIGRKSSAYALLLYLEHYSVGVDSHAGIVLGKTQLATEEADQVIYTITVSELGFTEKTERPMVVSRLKELGYTYCEPEVGPYLALYLRREAVRLQKAGEPCEDTKLLLMMEPIVFDEKNYNMFYIVQRLGGDVHLRVNNDMDRFDRFNPSDILVCQRIEQPATQTE